MKKLIQILIPTNLFIPIWIAVFILLGSAIGQADELKVSLSCWPKELKEAFALEGRKLDLNASERTEDSWGYMESKGSEYSIFTYRSATPEDFKVIQMIIWAIELEKGK